MRNLKLPTQTNSYKLRLKYQDTFMIYNVERKNYIAKKKSKTFEHTAF